VAGRFARQPAIATYVRYRNGPGHSDFTAPMERPVTPRGSWQFERPVIVLVGRGSFSSTEDFAAAMRVLPQVELAGDTTGGGSGNPGLFPLGEGWQYSVSRWFETTSDGIVIEWNGIPPDLRVPASRADFQSGRDPVFEFAVQRLGGQVRRGAAAGIGSPGKP
jgi:C-terminal processing protease CtpA/Prc